MRESTKHGPKLDDALKHETRPLEQGAPIEARTQESREAEGPADDERDVDSRTAPPGALGSDAVEARRELSRHLRSSAFPADRDALLAEAEEQNAPEPLVAVLRSLPAGESYATAHEVWAALEGHDEPDEAARTEPLSGADR
jgi:Protein of unknown function (DUF2795)